MKTDTLMREGNRYNLSCFKECIFLIVLFFPAPEHLDFMSTLDIDLDIKVFEQLQHASIGYQSLTDVPRAITYSEDSMSFKVRTGLDLPVIIHLIIY